jgi:mRNA interferase HigB
MRIIAKKTLKEFYTTANHIDAQSSLEAWYHEATKASWSNPNEIKAQYKSASLIGNNKVVFNICGNKYRLIVKINYLSQVIFIKFIGTHKEYDKLNIEEL